MSRHNRERRKRKAQPPKYVPQVAANAGLLKPGVYVIPVRHEDRCSLLRGVGGCDCDPEVGSPERVPAPDEN